MKRWIIHPFLFALFPVTTLLLNNLSILTPFSLVRAALVLQGAALLLWWLLSRFFRNARAAAVAASVLVFVFFLGRQEGGWGMPIFWGILFAGLMITGRWKPQRMAALSPAMTIMALILLLMQGAQFAQAYRPAPLEPVTFKPPARQDSREVPHIVHIVLDGFGRIDLLQKQFGCDVRFLQQHLESKGFFVATNATANYLKTMHSMGSTLSMDYLPGTSTTGLTSQTMLSRPQLDRLAGNSPVMNLLARSGYKCEGSVVSEVLLREWNTPSRIGLGVTFPERTFLQRTIIYPLLNDGGPPKGYGPKHAELLREHYARVKGAFDDNLQELAGPDPVFKIMHIIAPHPPFVFLADGRPQPYWQTDDFLFSDGNHYLYNDASWSNYREGYAEQVQYVAQETCRLVDRILTVSTRPVAIIVQGDHGSGLDFSFESSEGNLDGRASILMAIRLPGRTPPLSDDVQSPINLYRYLFRELWQPDIPLLPSRTFYSGWTSPEVYEDVTEKVAGQHRTWTFTETQEHRTVEAFLRATSSTWARMISEGWVYFDQVRHCAWDTTPLTNGTLTAIDHPTEAAAALNDYDLGTTWRIVLKAGRTTRVRIDFQEPVSMAGLRLISMERAWPGIRELKVETTQGPVVVLTNWVPSGFTWSGPELFLRDRKAQQELFFHSQTVIRIEMELFAVTDDDLVALNDIECLAPAPWPEQWRQSELMDALSQKGTQQVYAPRWLEQILHEKSEGRVAATLPMAYLRRSAFSYWRDMSSSLSPLQLTLNTVVVGYRSDLAQSQEAFQRAEITPHSQIMGPLVLFSFDQRNWKEEYSYNERLFDLDGRVRYDSDNLKTKNLARFFHEQAQPTGVPLTQKIKWLTRCVAAYPDYQPAWRQLSDLQLKAGNEPAALAARREWRERTEPASRCAASFEGGATLLGYTLATNRLTAGAQNTLIAFWQVPPSLSRANLSTFLHFRQGKWRFQGDRVFLDKHPSYVMRNQPFQEVFRQEMPFEVPADTPSGSYEIILGLYNRGSERRLKVQSEFEASKQAVKLPTTLTIGKP